MCRVTRVASRWLTFLVDYQKGFNIKPILLQKQNQANHKWFVDNDATHHAQVCV